MAKMQEAHHKALETMAEQQRIKLRTVASTAEEKSKVLVSKQTMLLQGATKARSTLEAEIQNLRKKLEDSRNEILETRKEMERSKAWSACLPAAPETSTPSEDEKSRSQTVKITSLEIMLADCEEDNEKMRYQLSTTRLELERAIELSSRAARLQAGASVAVVDMLVAYMQESLRRCMANARANFVDYKQEVAVEKERQHQLKYGEAAQERDALRIQCFELESQIEVLATKYNKTVADSRTKQNELTQVIEELKQTLIRETKEQKDKHETEIEGLKAAHIVTIGIHVKQISDLKKRLVLGEQAMTHCTKNLPEIEGKTTKILQEMEKKIQKYYDDEELEIVRCRLLATKSINRWLHQAAMKYTSLSLTVLRPHGITKYLNYWHAEAAKAGAAAAIERLQQEVDLGQGSSAKKEEKMKVERDLAVANASKDGKRRGGAAAYCSILHRWKWDTAAYVFRMWYFHRNENKIVRQQKKEYDEKHARDAEIKAKNDQEHTAQMELLGNHFDSLQADFQHFVDGAIDTEAELRLLSGCDLKLGNKMLKVAQSDPNMPERGDALTMLEMQTTMTMADGLLCNMKHDLMKAFAEDSDSEEEGDTLQGAGAPTVATVESEAEVLKYLEEEITNRKVLEIELLTQRFTQGLLLLAQSEVIGGLTKANQKDAFKFWKTLPKVTKQTEGGQAAAMRVISNMFDYAIEGWKTKPTTSVFFERWYFNAQDLLRKRIMSVVAEDFRMLRARMTWREKQTLVCQAQLKSVIAERDAIADYKVEYIAADLREHAHLSDVDDIRKDNDMARACAGANAAAQNAEAIARSNVGSVWPDANRFQNAMQHLEEFVKSSDNLKETQNMLSRWCQEAGLEPPDEHCRDLDQSMTRISQMIKGEDWPIEAALSGGESMPEKGLTNQSILRGHNPFRRKIPAKISENIADDYGAPGSYVFMSGKALKEATPKNAKEIWSVCMRQKAAMESEERNHKKVVAELKEKQANAITELVDSITGDQDSALNAIRREGEDKAAELQAQLDATVAAKAGMEQNLLAEQNNSVQSLEIETFQEAVINWQAACHFGFYRWSLSELQWSFSRWKHTAISIKSDRNAMDLGKISFHRRPLKQTAEVQRVLAQMDTVITDTKNPKSPRVSQASSSVRRKKQGFTNPSVDN